MVRGTGYSAVSLHYLLASFVISGDICHVLTPVLDFGQGLVLSLPVPAFELILVFRSPGLEQGALDRTCSGLGICLQHADVQRERGVDNHDAK